MILNIETTNPQQVLCDLREVWSDSKITIVNQWEKISEFKIEDKDGGECVYPLDGLIELKQYYGYRIRLR